MKVRNTIRHPLGGKGSTRRRKLIGGIVGLGSLALAGTALAFILLTFTGSTSTTATLPTNATTADISAAMAVTADINGNPFTDNSLTVGGSAPYVVRVDVGAIPSDGQVNGVNVTATPANPATCPANDFQVTPDGAVTYPLTLHAGSGHIAIQSGTIKLLNDPTHDQSGCGGQQITVSATLQ